MQLTVIRESLLQALQEIIGAVEKRQTLPILSNILWRASQKQLILTATDLEVELSYCIHLETPPSMTGSSTIPARRLMDICRLLPEQAPIRFTFFPETEQVEIQSGQSHFALSTLSAEDFPFIECGPTEAELSLTQQQLRFLIERCYFSMGEQDLRYFLNGMLLEIEPPFIHTATTDGHRLSLSTIELHGALTMQRRRIIIPRRGVLELLRLLSPTEDIVTFSMGENFVRLQTNNLIFTSKLIEGQFPNHRLIIPRGGDKQLIVPRDQLKRLLSRVAVISDEQRPGAHLQLREGILRVLLSNFHQEKAQDELMIDYQGTDLDIGFNIRYLLEILSAIPAREIKLVFSTAEHSFLVQAVDDDGCLYVIMPMRL